ncbi:MAG: hypothetical protein HOP12_07790 [Candidatus Eisenbacteria bacterium]|uniref:peptidylprolyl isomerase n=1 Tax=Eiseniibacteriota bacterium TaxID=2212470 RepID=A0A849SHK9_UNCEI|nr:hypothetical protein [Candidatus Eisenbacteria bacterium]
MRPAALWIAVLAVALAAPSGHARGVVKRENPAAVAVPAVDTLSAAEQRSLALAEDARRFEPELRAGLADSRAAVRARATLAVGRLQDSTTVPAVLSLLADSVAEVRREAVFALGQIGHRSARGALERRVLDTDFETARLAVEALGKLGDRAATPAILPWLGAPDARRRAEAAVALWRLADSTALDALLSRHNDPDPEVRWRVLWALEKVVAPQRVLLIAATHVEDASPRVRAYAVRTLGRQKSPRANAYLMQALADAEPAVVINALRALTSIGDTACRECADAVARRLTAPDPYVRVTAATALGERPLLTSASPADRDSVFAALARGLSDSDAATRGQCARALLVHRGDSAWTRVESVLEDSSVYARVNAMQGLAGVQTPEVRRWLEARLDERWPLFVRTTAVDLLGERRDRAVAPRLRAGLADREVLFAASCAAALQTLGDSASVPDLVRAFATRAAAADADVRNALRDAVRELAGRGFADSLERAHPAPTVRPAPEPEFATASSARGAVLHTTRGEIEWSFFNAEATQTVKNFVRLAERGYFNGLAVHRVVPNFVIQDGDPTGTGSGGPGYTIRCEYNRLRYEPGMVGMALSGKDTGGSQWFITHSPQLHLDGRYTIFARVARGLDVASRIVQGDRIERVEILH